MAQARQRVAVVDSSTGETATIEAGEFQRLAAEAQASGTDLEWELDTPDKRKLREYQAQAGYTDVIKAGFEGGASGVTGGVYDIVAGKLGGEEYRERRALQKETFGGIETGAEIVGAAAPLLFTGGASAAATGARAAATGARGLLGGAARAVAAPTVGAARVAEALGGAAVKGFGRLGVTGESVGGRALLGAAKLGVEGAAEGALQSVGHEMGNAALEGRDVLAAERIWGAAKQGAIFGGAGGAALGGVGGAVSGVARKAGGLLAKKTGVSSLDDLRAKLPEEARYNAVESLHPGKRAAREIARDADDIGQELIDNGLYIKQGRDEVAVMERARQVADEGTAKLNAAIAKADEIAPRVDTAALAKRLDDEVFGEIAARGVAGPKKAALKRVKGALRDLYDGEPLTHAQLRGLRKSLDESVVNWGTANDTISNAAGKKARALLEDHLEKSIAANAGDAIAAGYKADKKTVRAALWAEKQAQEVSTSGLSNRQPSLTDYISGNAGAVVGLASGSFGLGALGALGVGAANNYLRKYGRGHMVDIIETYRKGALAESKAIQRAVSAGSRAASAGRAAIGATAAAVVEHDSRKVLRAKKNESVDDAYQRTLVDLSSARMSRATPAIMESAPKVAVAMEETRRRAAEYLLETAPGPPRQSANPVLSRMHRDRPVDAGELRRWTRRKDAIENPQSVLDSIANGRLTREQVEAWAAVYPERLAALREATMAEVSEKQRDIPYERRVQLGLLLGIPLDPSLRPEQIRASQAAYAARAQAQPQLPRRSGTPNTSQHHRTRADALSADGLETM